MSEKQKEFAVEYDQELLDAIVKDHIATLTDENSEKTRTQTAIEQGILSQEELTAIYKDLQDQFVKGNAPKVNQDIVNEGIDKAVDRLDPEL